MTIWFEDLPLDFSREETRNAESLLVAGYSMSLDALRLAENAGLNPATLNQMAPVAHLMRDILHQARTSDRLTGLLAEVLADPARAAIRPGLLALVAGHEATIQAASMRRRPSLRTLALLPPDVDVWGADMHEPRPLAAPGLEAIVNAAAGFVDPVVLRDRLAEAEVRTARIEVGGSAKGTGFLVADDLLLTNWHVVSTARSGGAARFDYKLLAATDVEADMGRAVAFADEWLVASSEHASREVELGPDGPPDGLWDFAVVRLAEPAGAQAIGPDPAAQGDRRGHYPLLADAYEYDRAETIHILGHPARRPLQLSYASPSDVAPTQRGNRVRYRTNTEAGSSGSPVFNRDWTVVALHHAAGPTSTPGPLDQQSAGFNQGIPISGIAAELRRQLQGRPELAQLGLG